MGGGLVSALLYLGLIAIPMRYLFGVLTTLITLLAAGMAAQGVNFLQQGGWLEACSDPVWSASAVLLQDSMVGRVLHTLIGYRSADRNGACRLLWNDPGDADARASGGNIRAPKSCAGRIGKKIGGCWKLTDPLINVVNADFECSARAPPVRCAR